jgi:hypothetical protein
LDRGVGRVLAVPDFNGRDLGARVEERFERFVRVRTRVAIIASALVAAGNLPTSTHSASVQEAVGSLAVDALLDGAVVR